MGLSGREKEAIRGNSAGRMMGISQMTGEGFLGPELPAGQISQDCEAVGLGSSVRVRSTECRKPSLGLGRWAEPHLQEQGYCLPLTTVGPREA